MFPGQENILKENSLNEDKTAITGKSFLFDFTAGEFVLDDTGNLISINNIEALKIWIIKILKTDRDKFVVYDGVDYGVTNFRELITSNLPLEFIKAEIEKSVKEVLLKNTAIKSVQNFKFERNKRLLIVSFDCTTIYGTIGSEVIF